jgi:hypothetical protein
MPRFNSTNEVKRSRRIEFDFFKKENKTKAAKIEKTHNASMKILADKLEAAAKRITTSNNEVRRGHKKKVFGLEKQAIILKTQVNNQKRVIKKNEEKYTSASSDYNVVSKGQRDTIEIMHQTVETMRQSLSGMRAKLSDSYMNIDRAEDKADAVRIELNTLRYIIETGEHPFRESSFCPVSQTSLMRNDVVAVFEGDCNCNSMVKQSVSKPCVDSFNDGTDIRCMSCFQPCNNLVFSTTAQATANFTWRKLEKLTGCGDFDSVSDRNARLIEKRLDDQRAYTTRNVRDRHDDREQGGSSRT